MGWRGKWLVGLDNKSKNKGGWAPFPVEIKFFIKMIA